jgi:hypothetical protein
VADGLRNDRLRHRASFRTPGISNVRTDQRLLAYPLFGGLSIIPDAFGAEHLEAVALMA